MEKVLIILVCPYLCNISAQLRAVTLMSGIAAYLYYVGL